MTAWAQPTTFARCWTDVVESRPDETFMIFEYPPGPDHEECSIEEWTYAEFDREVQRVGSRLSSMGVIAGSSVHLALTNSPIFVALWLATIRLGAWIVPSDPFGTSSELGDHIKRTEPVVGVYSSQRTDAYHRAVGDSGRSLSLISVNEADGCFDEFPKGRFGRWATPGLRDRAAVLFTSGTTGKPKGVEITQANYAFAGRAMAEAAELTAEDRQIVVLPLFHANAQYYSFASAIWAGASIALMPSFSASGFLGQVARYEATTASLFAAPIRMILARGGPVDGANLRHCWFAQNISETDFETISDWFGCRPRQLYGMTETIPAVLTDRSESPEPHTMGTPTKGCEVTLSETGEILVRGEAGLTLFAAYLNEAEVTRASFSDGWFRTGDKASVDGHGRFCFEGRRSDVLKVAGENVSTAEVEAALLAHPSVEEAAVVGRADPIRDEVPVAFVVVSTDLELDRAELDSWCEGRLSKAKRPVHIQFMDSLPRTSVGKIRTFILRQLAQPEEAKS